MTYEDLKTLVYSHSNLATEDDLEEEALLSDICDSLDFACIFWEIENELGITIDSYAAMKLSKGTFSDLWITIEMVEEFING